ncbi:response regulator [Arcobacteraceae bacterium]|nr:response regulator [Arcobacteraceae bacterium]
MKLDTKELKNITILYVEDDSIVREQTQAIFEKLFKKVFIAVDGQNGLEVFTQNQDSIDIVVTDINMPNMNGLEMIKKINELNHSIPTIVTTAHTDSSFLMSAIDINVDKYIAKPLQIKELTVSIVNSVLKYRRLNNIENLAKNLVSKSSKDDNLNSTLSAQLDIAVKQNKYYKAIIDSLVATFKVDKNGNITETSDKFLRFFNFEKDDIIGKSINILQCDTCTQESFQKLMLKAIHSKKSVVSTYVFKTQNGKSINCDMSLAPEYNSSNLVSGYTIYLDILE